MKKSLHLVVALLVWAAATLSAQAADYTTYLTAVRGFTEVTSTDGITGNANDYYILVPAESHEFIVGIGSYEEKPNWAHEDPKALRLHSAATDPVTDLTNFFTIEKENGYIGLRNVVYNSDLFQTHLNEGFMYVLTFTDKNLDEWSYLIPHWQNDGYWLFENGKYPISSTAQWKGYMGSWTPGRMALNEPIALNRLNTDGDPAGHYRLFRITKNDLMVLHFQAMLSSSFTEVTSANEIIADNQYCYLITAAETNNLYVGVGAYAGKPDWASEESKALRYKTVEQVPVLDLSNFFTIEKSGSYIGLRNMVYSADLFQTHRDAGYMYVNTYTDKTLDEWSYLTPTYQNGYWMFGNGKYPDYGYMGPWNKNVGVAENEAIALDRKDTTGDEAGRYRLWRIAKTDLLALHRAQNRLQMYTATSNNTVDATWVITNPSFETGDETGWTLQNKEDGNNEFKTRDYAMSNKEGGYLMNVYQWWNDHSVSQIVDNVPSGQYELSAVLCSWGDRTATLSGISTKASATATAQGVNDQTGTRVSVNVTVGNDQQLTIVANSTTDWWSKGHEEDNYYKQLFYKVDDVRLTCKGVFLNAYAIPLPNDDNTLLQAEQWYYYDVPYSMEYRLIGNVSNMTYSADGEKIMPEVTVAAASRHMTLPKGRVYFKTTRSDATLSLHPARNVEELGTFTAVALNVDGLPNSILTIELNPDGPGSEGTKKISKYLASKGYDMIGCSEDFNYHGSLISSLQGDYSWGQERASLSASGLSLSMLLNGFRFDTDGLNLLWKNSTCSAANESWTQWNSMASTDGNQYVKKGYRHYDMTVGGQTFDVFILHMDAGDKSDAINSRHSQWEQLAGAINGTDLNRPKLVIGDTNSRWTREDITSHFMNLLNSNLTASDVWVEFARDGIYPTTDMSDLTDGSDPTNYTNYEIVDKIIYINPKAANTLQLVPQSFRIEQDYTYGKVKELDGGVNDDNTPLGDHRPVVVTFKYVKSGDAQNIPVTLTNDADNTKTISDYSGLTADVTLSGRTLYKDGAWNTLCLPFKMTAEQVTAQLQGAELKELDITATVDGHKTGLEGTTLYLNFKDANAITAGKPYVIKWASGSDLVNPLFTGVTISTATPAEVRSTDGSVAFQGTYGPVALPKDDKTNLFMDADNTLSWPSVTDYHVNAFRAYFRLSSANSAREFVLNFGDAEATGISATLNNKEERIKNHYYDLSGRRLEGRPTKPGVYMSSGQKVVMR